MKERLISLKWMYHGFGSRRGCMGQYHESELSRKLGWRKVQTGLFQMEVDFRKEKSI